MKRLASHLALMIGLALVFVVGCGRSGDIETARVYGTVTLDGKPYTDGGSVQFWPQFNAKMAGGPIQSDGSFELSTYALGDGAAVGSHKVAIVPKALPDEDDLSDQPSPAPSRSRIPQKYQSPSSSGFVFEVQAGRSNEFPIEMKSK